jgi:hypothetical protein
MLISKLKIKTKQKRFTINRRRDREDGEGDRYTR